MNKRYCFLLLVPAIALVSFLLAEDKSTVLTSEPRFPKSIEKLDEQTKPASSKWLLDANDDTERFRRLEIVASGTDKPMWEVGHRFGEVHVAIQKDNWELASYHWEKIRNLTRVAGLKRPKRTPNLENMFLESGVWSAMNDAILSRDRAKMKSQFLTTRQVCMACHLAEKLGFINDSSVFDQTVLFPSANSKQAEQD
jgi:hypothetical protein